MKQRIPKTWLDVTLLRIMGEASAHAGKPATIEETLSVVRRMAELYDASVPANQDIPKDRVPVLFNQRALATGLSVDTLYDIAIETASLHPFWTFHPQACGIQVTDSILEMFAGATTPNNDAVLESLLKRAWYFDFLQSNLTFTLKGKTQYPRAVFINPIAGVTKDLCYWRGTPSPVVYLFYDDGQPTSKCGEDYLYWFWHTDNSKDKDFESHVQETFESLISLITLYFTITPAERREVLPALLLRKIAKQRPINQQKALYDMSLFRMVRMTAPADRLGRPQQETTPTNKDNPYQLDKRFTVRGHFRLQACGPRFSERRLRWIDAYEKGPKDAPVAKIPMYRV